MLVNICGFEFKITNDKSEYQDYKGASINYSSKAFDKIEIRVSPASLLFEESIKPVAPRIEKKPQDVYFYLPSTDSNEWVNDPFSASFFLLSRYEEYLPFTASKYNSYEAGSSISFREKILDRPLVNEWAEQLKRQILEKFPSTDFRINEFSPLISIDIDQAYAFQHRGCWRNLLSIARNSFSFNGKMLSAHLKTFFLKQQDPYDTYDYLKKIQEKSKLPFIYFVNLGNYSSFDKNLDSQNTAMIKLLTEINSYSPVGIHPSYFSNDMPGKFIAEKQSLETVLNKPVTKSRQHYLKIKMPDTYHHLINAGITEDYSMGYSTQPGFRAGTCTPFQWFDLSKNLETSLHIFPITFMDGNFGEDLKMNPEEAGQAMSAYIDTVKAYKGTFLCIWHNQTVNDRFFWKGWKKIFEQLIEELNAEI